MSITKPQSSGLTKGYTVRIDPETSDFIRDFSHENRCTKSSVILAALKDYQVKYEREKLRKSNA
jgi:hypothetical protein